MPPKIDQGRANGLEGTANSNTAEAPIGAINIVTEAAFPSITYLGRLVSKTPMKAPIQARKRSVWLTAIGTGEKLRIHSIYLFMRLSKGKIYKFYNMHHLSVWSSDECTISCSCTGTVDVYV